MLRVPRIPLLAGSRVQLVTVDDDDALLAPPAPLEALADVADATAGALRYPLSGPPLGDLVTPGGRATIVVELPTLPLPGAALDPRQEALAGVIDELDRLGMPRERHTVLVAGGLERRAGRAALEALLRPSRARDFHGALVVHDCTDEELRPVETGDGTTVRLAPAMLDADLLVTVTAAETADRGGAATLVQATGAETIRALPAAPSLLAPSASPAAALGSAIEEALSGRLAVAGVSLVLDHPRLTGRYHGYPSSEEAVRATAQSSLRRLLNALPHGLRDRIMQRQPRDLRAAAALAGRPSVAHTEALLRGIALRGAHLERPVDTLVVPLPWKALHQPREPLNPITAASVGLGLAARLWREEAPLEQGGTIVLLHDFGRTFGHGPQAPFRALFRALREGREPARIAAAEQAAGDDRRALAAYREGRAPHPLLPFVDWSACGPALERAGCVIVGCCRDAGAARALGFVPSHNATTALEMARGLAGGRQRLGVLLAPPYPPLLVSD